MASLAVSSSAATRGWNGTTRLALQARKSSHKEFSFLLDAIKCLSAFLFHLVPFQLRPIG